MRRQVIDNTQTVFIDLSMLLVVGLAAVLAMVVAMVNPESNKVSVPAAGDLVVEAYWPDDQNIDVDLWVRSPNDDQAVGYSRRAGQQTNYLRDDTGTHNDPSGKNFEFAFSRGRVPGTYVINVHLFNRRGYTAPVPVKVVASLMKNGRHQMTIASRTVYLKENGAEETVLSFELGADGEFVPGSVSHEYIPLRSGGDDHYEEDY